MSLKEDYRIKKNTKFYTFVTPRKIWVLGKTKYHLREGGYWYSIPGQEENRSSGLHAAFWCGMNGLKRLPKGYSVHHLDHNHSNNSPNNLACIPTKVHNRHHVEFRRWLRNKGKQLELFANNSILYKPIYWIKVKEYICEVH